MAEKSKNKKLLVASNVFSGMGSLAAACCAGPGLVACSAACAPSCGSLGFTIFGLSSTALTSWILEYWYVFLCLSIVCFMVAYYRLFIKKTCNEHRRSKVIFVVSLLITIVAYSYLYFS